MKKLKKSIFYTATFISAAFIFSACASSESENENTQETVESQETTSVTFTEKETAETTGNTSPPETLEKTHETLSLLAVGDNLIHDTVYDAFYEGDNTYDFNALYDRVRYKVQDYDIAVINQETIFVENNEDASNYPEFGTPHEMGEALVNAGFDVILSATNHTMDKGADTIRYMYNYWKERYPEKTLLGIHDSKEDSLKVNVVEKNGIRLAMFNYTYGLNGYVLPEGEEYLVDLLDDKEKFLSDIEAAENEVDMTVCFLHIGEEYIYEPTEYQKQYIEDVIDAGADLVICAHPHVVEPFGEVMTENGNKGLVYYSCGNFVSGQTEIDRLLGGMASVTIEKTGDGEISETVISDYDFIPVVMHYSDSETAVYMLEDYSDSLAEAHSIYEYDDRMSVDYLYELWNYITNTKQ